MAIATTLKSFLDEHHVQYDVVEHAHSHSSLESAHQASVPGHQVAKAVVLEDSKGIVVSVLPSTKRLNLEEVNDSLGRKLKLVPEDELSTLFGDCDLGAVPALGNAYGLDVVWDDDLRGATDIYIEAGDHEHLIHTDGEDFRRLVEGMPHSLISAEKDQSNWMGR